MLIRRVHIFFVFFLVALSQGALARASLGQANNKPPVRGQYGPVDLLEESSFRAEQSAGLFVGVRDYLGDFPQVPFSVDDAIDLAYVFSFDLGLIEPGNVTLCLSGTPQKDSSKARLKELADNGAHLAGATIFEIHRYLDLVPKQAGEDGFLVISFASHGLGDYLITRDTPRDSIEKGISHVQVSRAVESSRSRRSLVLFDACRRVLESRSSRAAGGGPVAPYASERLAEAISDFSGSIVLLSTKAGGVSYDNEIRKNGVFTGAVIDGLLGEAPTGGRGFITIEALADFVNGEVISWIENAFEDSSRMIKGIIRKIEPSAEGMPLAVPREINYKRRRAEGMRKLQRFVAAGEVPEKFRIGINLFLQEDDPGQLHWRVVEEMRVLSGDIRSLRSFLYFVKENIFIEGFSGSVFSQSSPELRSRDLVQGGLWEETVLGLRFRYIQARPFVMGGVSIGGVKGFQDDDTQSVEMSHEFLIGESEVSQSQWAKIFLSNPSYFDGCGGDCPVERVSWFDAVRFANELSELEGLAKCYDLDCSGEPGVGCENDTFFCRGAFACKKVVFHGVECEGYRLPMAAEWEFAARAGRSGTVLDRDVHVNGWCSGYGDAGTHPVKKKKPNAWSLYDTIGNVAEWTNDSARSVEKGRIGKPYFDDKPRELKGPARILRGGHWGSQEGTCRLGSRYSSGPHARSPMFGLRLARTVSHE